MTTTKKPIAAFVTGGTGQVYPFDNKFTWSFPISKETDIKNIDLADVLIVWGGADISPTIYGEKPSASCGAGANLSNRDALEANAMQEAIKQGVPIIGVCRGAQLACAIAGGTLYQHVDGHVGGRHSICTSDNRTIYTTSAHHQMMKPWDVEHKLLAWTTTGRRHIHLNQDDKDITHTLPVEGESVLEPEVVFFPKIKALAIQGHPEWCSLEKEDQAEFIMYCRELVDQYIVKDEHVLDW